MWAARDEVREGDRVPAQSADNDVERRNLTTLPWLPAPAATSMTCSVKKKRGRETGGCRGLLRCLCMSACVCSQWNEGSGGVERSVEKKS